MTARDDIDGNGDRPFDVGDCTCVHTCVEDPATACSLSGRFHVHPDDGSGTFGPCPVHPDADGTPTDQSLAEILGSTDEAYLAAVRPALDRIHRAETQGDQR